MTNSEAYSSFASIGSDHRIFTVKVRLSLRANSKSPPKKIRYSWNKLVSDPDLQERYSVEVKNRFSALCETINDEDQSARYGCLTQANKETTAKALCYDVNVEKARHYLKEAYEKLVTENTNDSNLEFEIRKRNLDDAYEAANRQYMDKKLNEFEEADKHHQHKMAWDLVNEISGRKNSRSGRLKGATKEERIWSWYDHFQQLLGNPPTATHEDEEIPIVFEDLPIR